MTTPLAFLVYAAWGHLAGFETWQLRLLSPILAIATCAVLNAGLRSYGVGRAARTIAVATLCVNPYFVGVGVFVYTDMLALLMLAVLIVAVGRERAWLAALGAGAGVLTRQYELFAVSGFIAAASRTWQRGSLVVAVALLPAAALCWLWHGLAPVSDMRTVYLAEPIRFHLPWLSLYLAAPGIYEIGRVHV